MNRMEEFGGGMLVVLLLGFVIWGVLIAPIRISQMDSTIDKYKQILVKNKLAAYSNAGELYLIDSDDK